MSLSKVNYIDNSTIITAKNLNDIQDNIIKLNKLEDKIIYGKGKNLLKNTAKSVIRYGIEFTVNDDGSVTANGTSTGRAQLYWKQILPAGKYIYSIGLEASHNGPTGFIAHAGNDGTIYHDIGANDYVKFSFITETEFTAYVEIRTADYTANNVTFYPMIRLASETDDTYEPYYEGIMESVSKSQVVNNFTTTEEGFVADARALKALNDVIDKKIQVGNSQSSNFFTIDFTNYAEGLYEVLSPCNYCVLSKSSTALYVRFEVNTSDGFTSSVSEQNLKFFTGSWNVPIYIRPLCLK